MAKHIITGHIGENIAKEFLIQKGYQIMYENYRVGRAEFDLIVKNEIGQWCFVEVKARKSDQDEPEKVISAKKQTTLIEGVEKFKLKMNLNEECFFEVIAIQFKSNKKIEIFHIKDAFFLMYKLGCKNIKSSLFISVVF